MTLAFMPLALESTYRSTGVPSAVLPNGIFSIPAGTFCAPFSSAAARVDEHQSPNNATVPSSAAYLDMGQLLGKRPGCTSQSQDDDIAVTGPDQGFICCTALSSRSSASPASSRLMAAQKP